MTREDLYEAAVRAVLDLCDEADDVDSGASGVVGTTEIRKAIKDALLVDEEEAI